MIACKILNGSIVAIEFSLRFLRVLMFFAFKIDGFFSADLPA